MKTNVFKKAHEITKKIIKKGDGYRETFRLALIFVYSEIRKGVNKMIELKGTEKQIKWANDIREKLIEKMNIAINELEAFQADTVKGGGKRVKRRDRFINEMKNEISLISEIKEAEEIIETYKYVYKVDVNELLNKPISKLKEEI